MEVSGNQTVKKNDLDQQGKVHQKDNFIETVHAVQEMMESSAATLRREEIAAYFECMDLTGQQMELVYDYLQSPQEEPLTKMEPKNTLKTEHEQGSTDLTNKRKLPDNAFFRMYLEDLNKIVPCTSEEETRLYERLVEGDETTIPPLLEQWLRRVINIVQLQAENTDPKDWADMIQEGNLSVLLVLEQIAGSKQKLDFEEALTNAIKQAVGSYTQKIAADAKMDQSVLSKAERVYEARAYLAKQLQRLPSIDELSQYTKLPEVELEHILAILEGNESC